jgi:hypothetical protein
VPSWLTNTALTKAYAKLKDAGGGLAENFAQRKQAESMFVDATTSIARSVRRFRSFNPKLWAQVVRSHIGNIPEKWLALQYGWIPMMSDVADACRVASEADKVPPRKRVAATAKDTGGYELAYYSDPSSYRRTKRTQTQVKVILYFVLENPYIIPYAQLGLTNPADLVWELVPYSFVVDWFLPIGPWIETWDATLGWKFQGGTKTVWREVKTEVIPTGISPTVLKSYPDSYVIEQPAKGYARRMDRTVYSSAPRVGFPSFKNPLSPQHVANAMSLLVSAFR